MNTCPHCGERMYGRGWLRFHQTSLLIGGLCGLAYIAGAVVVWALVFVVQP